MISSSPSEAAGGRSDPAPREADVVVVGGAFAGASIALLLRRADPSRRVVVVEKNAAFDRKVGESAIELSSWFLTRVLGLDRHLSLRHLPKYGLRFWFTNGTVRGLADASELGNRYQTRLPGCHIDRAILDEHVLSLARDAGAAILRPARVVDLDLREGERSTVVVESASGRETISARWVVDASGRRAWLARRLGLLSAMPEHPTRSVWARYRGVRDFDGDWLPGRLGAGGGASCSRGLSTNHFTGPGWWVWVIPLPGGDTSVGVVWDERIASLPPGGTLGERFESFMRSFPAGREFMEGAERVEGDLHQLNDLPYGAGRLMGDGWALVGDASGFIDPFYSPGLDWGTLTVAHTARIVGASLKGEDPRGEIERHNRHFTRSFRRWVEAIYLDKYYYLGEFELMEIALRLEVALYYFGIVTPPYRDGLKGFVPPYSLPISTPFFLLMRFVNRRLASIGKARLAAGTWGRRNAGRRVLLPGFRPGASGLKYVPGVLARLAFQEAKTIPARLAARRLREAHPVRADRAV